MAAAALWLFLTAPAAATDTQARFAIQALGVTIADLAFSGTQADGRYAVEARFATRGVFRALSRISAEMSAQGRITGARWGTDRYAERVTFGRRQAASSLTYPGGVPRLDGVKPGTEDTVPVNPAAQRDTVDPLTAMFRILRDQPRAGLCDLDQPVFDGVRRTRVQLDETVEQEESVLCRGVFLREAGYRAETLAEGASFPFEVEYAPVGDVMQARRLTLSTIYGPMRMIRR